MIGSKTAVFLPIPDNESQTRKSFLSTSSFRWRHKKNQIFFIVTLKKNLLFVCITVVVAVVDDVVLQLDVGLLDWK